MRFPKPTYTPPKWYWRLPLRWRQRYCRWVIWKWEALHGFFTHILTKETFCRRIPAAASFTWYCWRTDRAQRMPPLDRLCHLGGYWRTCWRSWLHPLPPEGI